MDSLEKGKLIAKLRREAGYTQKKLAQALFVTDKAISKWERGVCMPDSALLPRLSMLLDADVEYLISGQSPYGQHQWVGELRVENVRGTIADKPLIHYLISYFMLVGITDIAILTSDRGYIRGLKLEQYGINVSFTSFRAEKTMIIYDKFLLFGVNLTRQFQHSMSYEDNVILRLYDREVPVVFSHWGMGTSIEWNRSKAVVKPLGRGTIYIPLNTEMEKRDASLFVGMYEKYHGEKIADLAEIAVARRLFAK